MLNWIRLDTAIFQNPKFLYLADDGHYKAIVIHIEAMCYSARLGLAGYVPKAALRRFGGSSADARRLVEANLWETAPEGWNINDWNEYQLCDPDAVARSQKAKRAAHKRWHPDDA